MKTCLHCKTNVKAKAIECPYCGHRNFEQSNIHSEPTIITIEQNNQINPYSDKLMSLIDLALSDGELTEKEKQVLFKKAESEGIDLDEFEMVLNSKLKLLQTPKKTETIPLSREANTRAYTQLEQLIDFSLQDGVLSDFEKETIINKGINLGICKNEIDIILNSKLEEKKKILAQTSAPRSDKFGDIKKCPSCGAIAQSFTIKCTDCGYDFNNIEANVSIQKLFLLISELDDRYSNPNEKIGLTSLFTNALSKASNSEQLINRKCELIKNFPIPNTKNDILEFLTVAVPHARKVKKGIGRFFTSKEMIGSDSNTYKEQQLSKAWQYKCEQIIVKARFLMKEDKKTLDEVESYAQILGIK